MAPSFQSVRKMVNARKLNQNGREKKGENFQSPIELKPTISYNDNSSAGMETKPWNTTAKIISQKSEEREREHRDVSMYLVLSEPEDRTSAVRRPTHRGSPVENGGATVYKREKARERESKEGGCSKKQEHQEPTTLECAQQPSPSAQISWSELFLPGGRRMPMPRIKNKQTC